jgi:hypothetical protein
VQQLPFWVLLEEGREEPAVEEDKGLLHLPSSAFLDGFKALALDSQGSLGLYWFALLPEEKGEIFDELAYLVIPDEAGLKVLDTELFRKEAFRSSGPDYKHVALFKGSLRGSLFWREAVFSAKCITERKKAFPCGVVVSLGEP